MRFRMNRPEAASGIPILPEGQGLPSEGGTDPAAVSTPEAAKPPDNQ